uniref:hypothetical protein n=1 Tax=Halomonas sp. TaxID=1486246 RepID=UPI00262D5790|nr:hypothetical protein [Halomonas sp.]
MARCWKALYTALTLVVAIGVASLMVYVALDHNPQGEFCAYADDMTSCRVRWGPVALVFGLWFAVVALAMTVPAMVVDLIVRAVGWIKARVKC